MEEIIINLDFKVIEMIAIACLVLSGGAVAGSIALLIEAFKKEK